VDERDAVYTMAVASRLTGMHPQTLRKYERAGLLRPSRVNGNQRLYSEADLQRLLRIQYLVESRGLNIAGLEMTLAMSDRLDDVGPDATRAEMQAAFDDVSGMSRDTGPKRGSSDDHTDHPGDTATRL
jgi:MerR family transcriptional regulator/heat shock protein HspR